MAKKSRGDNIDWNADEIIRKLQLESHAEGGWYRQIWLSELMIPQNALSAAYDSDRNSASIIYYLLKKGERSAWHRLKSPETWMWLAGGRLTLTLGGTASRPKAQETFLLGSYSDKDADTHLTIPANVWQTAEMDHGDFVLISCIMSPAFVPEDWELA